MASRASAAAMLPVGVGVFDPPPPPLPALPEPPPPPPPLPPPPPAPPPDPKGLPKSVKFSVVLAVVVTDGIIVSADFQQPPGEVGVAGVEDGDEKGWW